MGPLLPSRHALVLLLWPLAACSGDKVLGDYPTCTCDLAEPPAQLRHVPLTIATFWEDQQEKRALDTFTEPIRKRGHYLVTGQKLATRDEVQRHIREAFVTREPPDIFQVNGGSNVLRWVDGRPSDATDVCALDRLRDGTEWKRDYFSDALEPLSCNGALYGLPVGIHHINVLLYNRDLFEQLETLARASGRELLPPEALKNGYELVEWLEQVDGLSRTRSGPPLVPLALGSANAWPLALVAFENVLLSLTDDAYETLWLGRLEGAGRARRTELRLALTKMLEVLRGLLQVSNFDQGWTWREAVEQVGRGDALLTINGDWAFAAVPEEAKERVVVSTFPGTNSKFVYTPDSFAVPRDLKRNGFPARFFLRDVVGDKSALLAFSKIKHAIPPRRDLETGDLEELERAGLRSTYEEFVRCTEPNSGCRTVLAVSGLAPPPGIDPCFDEIEALLRYAVTDIEPEHDSGGDRLCTKWPFPDDGAEAEARLLDVLIEIGGQRYAKGCR